MLKHVVASGFRACEKTASYVVSGFSRTTPVRLNSCGHCWRFFHTLRQVQTPTGPPKGGHYVRFFHGLFALSCLVVLGAALPVHAQPPSGNTQQSSIDEGIPVTSDLVKRKCGACHRADEKGRLSRISYRRTTPEGWEQTIKRMITLNNITLEPAEARDVLRYLGDRHGLAPEEAKPADFEVERRLIEYTYAGDKDTEQLCTTCHSIGRVISQRRTKEEWTLLLETHRAIYPGTDTVFRRTVGQRRQAGLPATQIIVSVSVAPDATVGRRSVIVSGATGEATVAVYNTIDFVKVRPQSGLARLGGGAAYQKQFQQFEAVGYAKGPDGKPDTKDDVELGLLDAYWSIEEYAATFNDDDKDFVGQIDAETGLFTPNVDGPNPKRRHSANNYGDVWVVASYPRIPGGATGLNTRVVKGRAHLLVTVPAYILFDQPEVAR